MKAAHLLHLDTTFVKTKELGIDNSSGSITPRTTTKKVILDQVSTSPQANKIYQEQKSIKSCEVLGKLERDLQSRYEEKNLLSELSQRNSKYIQSDYLSKIDEELQSLQYELERIIKSQSIQDNCDIISFGFETIYQEGIAENSDGELNEDTPAVLRYGLNKDNLIPLEGSYIEKGLLHPYEIELFRLAIGYLNMTPSSEAYIQDTTPGKPYANNAVLVDIFDRSTDFVNEGNNQTHTVVLWRKRDNETMLIDPSNVNFSKNIANIYDFTTAKIPGNTIYSTNGKHTEYVSYEEEIAKPRDCVDIAVKIAFEINEQQKEGTGIEQIEQNVYRQISNISSIKLNPIKTLNTTFIRELQSTSNTTRKSANSLLSQNKDKIEILARSYNFKNSDNSQSMSLSNLNTLLNNSFIKN